MAINSLINKINIPGLPQVIPVLAVMMEVFWIYTWLMWISTLPALRWDSTPLNLVSCLVLGILVEVTARLALNSRWSLKKVRLVILPASFVFLFIVIRFNLGGDYAIYDPRWFNYIGGETSELVTASVFGTFIIWRGISSGQQDSSFTSIYRRFLTGLICIILILVIWRLGNSQLSNIWHGVGLEVLLFFGCGLLALAIANLERLRLELLQHQEATASFSRRWISMLIIMVIAILGLGILLTGLLSQETGAAIVRFLGMLGHWLLTGLLYLLYPVGFLVQVLLWVGRYLLALIRREPPPPLDPNAMGGNMPETLVAGDGALPPALVTAMKWGSILIAAGLVIFFLSRLLSRYYKVKTEEGIEEVHETLGSWNLLKMDLRGFLTWLFGRLRRRKNLQKPDDHTLRSAALDEASDKQFTIREIYQAILWEGRYNGTPRRSSETPYEYSRRLKERRENMAQELDTLTESYIIERYGQINPEPEKVLWLNRVWRSLRDKFRSKGSDL